MIAADLGLSHSGRAAQRVERCAALPRRPVRRTAVAARQIPSQDLLRQLLRYEPETGKLFWLPRAPHHFPNSRPTRLAAHCENWNYLHAGKEALCQRCRAGYLRGNLLGITQKAHRVIYVWMTGQEPVEIDHINGVRDDNRWSNLRNVTTAEQSKNRAKSSLNASGCTGVRKENGCNSWRVQIGKRYIGMYPTFEAAVSARLKAEAEQGYDPQHGKRSITAPLPQCEERVVSYFQIDKGLPIPELRYGRPWNRYPFSQMEVGDSFFCFGSTSSVQAAANGYGKRNGCKFTARYVEGGTRVWRVA